MKYCIPDRASQHLRLSSGPWRLKRLHLCYVPLGNRFMKHVSSVCFSLEDLELDDCTCDILSITSHSLKTLVLKNCSWYKVSKITSRTLEALVIDGVTSTYDGVLVILAPVVEYLHLNVYVDCFSCGISINEAPSLAKASIHLQDHRYRSSTSKLCGDQFKLLCSISSATSLELSGVRSMVLGEEPMSLQFKNLRNLLLDNCDLSDKFHILIFFIKNSPILEKLTVRCCEFPKYYDNKKGMAKLKISRRLPLLVSSKKASSSQLCGLDLLCENLKVEIIYKRGYGSHLRGYGSHLLQLLMRVLVNLSKKNIKLTEVAN